MKKINLEKMIIVIPEHADEAYPLSSQNDSMAIADVITWILPRVSSSVSATKALERTEKSAAIEGESQISVLRKIVKNSGIYALSSVAIPLVSLALSPFLTHNLTPADYGILTIINTAIGLTAGVTQLGLGSAFFRAYSYDYTSQQDRHNVLATATTLLSLASLATVLIITLTAPWLANLLFGRPELSKYIALAGGVVLMQNLTIPGLIWLRAEGRPLIYSLLSISNLIVMLLTTLFLVGGLHWGIAGSIIAVGSGYSCIAICTLPVIIFRVGIKICVMMAKGMLAFGLPLILNFVSYWILQLSDRYLLGIFASLTEAARYAVVYTLGSAMSVVVTGPFAMVWPTALFAIAKRKDADQVFQILFRWFSMILLFFAFSLSFVATVLLNWLFPVIYHGAAFVIPFVACSIVFFGIYYVFIVGVNIKRKTWLISIFMTAAASVNICLNLALIPHYGALGAALSTLLAYMLLAAIAYIVNQRLYPIPFEISIFTLALCIGIAFYVGCDFLAQGQQIYIAWGIHLCTIVLYGGCLACLGMFPTWRYKYALKMLKERKNDE